MVRSVSTHRLLVVFPLVILVLLAGLLPPANHVFAVTTGTERLALATTSICGLEDTATASIGGSSINVLVPSGNTPVVQWESHYGIPGEDARVFDPQIVSLNPPFDSQQYGLIQNTLVGWSAYENIETATSGTQACGVSVVLNSLSGPPGTVITVTGSGWPYPGDAIEACLWACPVTSIPVDNNGNFQATLTVPTATPLGDSVVTFDSTISRTHYAVNFYNFTVTSSSSVPAPPTLQTPNNGVNLPVGTSIVFTWAGAGDAYYPEVWSISPISGPAESPGWQSSTLWTSLPASNAGFTYGWHVKARNSIGESAWSPTWTYNIVDVTPPAPIANFDASPTSGAAPLTVSMHNTSTGNITGCIWNYGDGQTENSCAASHSHLYTSPGNYTVNLTASGPGGSNTKTRSNYIAVAPTSPPTPTRANFTASPRTGIAPLTVGFTDTSTGNPTNWVWDFDNNGTTDSTQQNPSYTYNTPGKYTVKLTTSGPGGSNAKTSASNYITVSVPASNTYAISGNIYVDTNENGAKDPGEGNYGGVIVTLSGAATKSTTTDANGNYSFTGLQANSYIVTLSLPTGYHATTIYPVNVPLTANTTVNFGVASTPLPTPTKIAVSLSPNVHNRPWVVSNEEALQISLNANNKPAPFTGINRFDLNVGPESVGYTDYQGILNATYDRLNSPVIGSFSPVFYSDGGVSITHSYSVKSVFSAPNMTLSTQEATAINSFILAKNFFDPTDPATYIEFFKLYEFPRFFKYFELILNTKNTVNDFSNYFAVTGDIYHQTLYEYTSTTSNFPVVYRYNLQVERNGKIDYSGSLWASPDGTNPPDKLLGDLREIMRDVRGGIIGTVQSPANIYLTDPQGRRTGFDPVTHQILNEIPDSYYSGLGSEPQVVTVFTPIDGTYTLTAVGTASGTVHLNLDALHPFSNSSNQSLTTTITPNQVLKQTISYGDNIYLPIIKQ